MLSKSLIQFSADGWGCNLASGRGNGDLLQKDLCQRTVAPRTLVVGASDPLQATASSRLCRRLPDIHRQVCLSLFWGHCSFPLGPGGYKVLLCPPRAYFLGGSQSFLLDPQVVPNNLLWALELLQQGENFFGIFVLQLVDCLLGSPMLLLKATSSKRTYATRCASQVCCSQSPYPMAGHCQPISLQETRKHRSGSVSCGGSLFLFFGLGAYKVVFAPSKHLWRV